MSIIERARASGRYPPSLLQDSRSGGEDGFDAAVLKVLDANELYLSPAPSVPRDFQSLLQMASGLDIVPGNDVEDKKATLVSRRCIILALVGSTPNSSSSLELILQSGYLNVVKRWMDDILRGSVGGVDLLLHLFTNITQLPVTKSVVKESGMGKAIGSVEKNRICAGTLNEGPIKERVASIKDAWNKSVKARKDKQSENKASMKRELEQSIQAPEPIVKKAKVEETKKSSSLSSLMRKMTPVSSNKSGQPSSDSLKSSPNLDPTKKISAQKKQKKRVKWKDHFGGNLTASKILENGDSSETREHSEEPSVSWSDRKKRDRLREKELLAKAKKAKLTDDDDDMGGMIPEKQITRGIHAVVGWHAPLLLPERTDPPPPHVNSKEKVAQTTRMASVTPAKYTSEYNVPNNPTSLSDVEQALDMTSQSSTVTQSIPFFVPQAVAPTTTVADALPQGVPTTNYSAPPPPPGVASAEIVQSLGLPMFLIGQNVQALQTLASTPSLLSTFVDSTGMYDQIRLTSLVQTLSQGTLTPVQQPSVSTGYGSSRFENVAGGAFGPGSSSNGVYGPAPTSAGNSGYRGAQNSGEGNLHLSGYGPSTTQAEIIALFSPYVQVDEVVMKTTFCFVNTSDPVGAKRAREALNGALLGGQPVRINMAQRKNRDSTPGVDPYGSSIATTGTSYYGHQASTFTPSVGATSPGFGPPAAQPSLTTSQVPGQGLPIVGGDYSNVRDDRGNPATKNLFVAGYGQGTTETLLRQIFSSHCEIVGVIMKGTFCFINTADRGQAVRARDALSGTLLNGGVLRINFAKESGRLGTSFDLTYGNKAPSRSHYGPRGF